MKSTRALLITLVCLLQVAVSSGYARGSGSERSASSSTSPNFVLPFDAMNSGGGGQVSVNYRMTSAIGDSIAGRVISSSSVKVEGGFIGQLYGTVFSCILDIDGNGRIDALTDGLMILRVLFGLTGASVTANAVGPQASRATWDAIRPLVHHIALDIDGNGQTDALTDGLLVMRALFGLTGTPVTRGTIGIDATRADWVSVRDYLNTACGTTLAQ